MPEREKDTKPELKGFQISLSQKQFFSWEPLVSLNKALVGPYFLGGGWPWGVPLIVSLTSSKPFLPLLIEWIDQ